MGKWQGSKRGVSLMWRNGSGEMGKVAGEQAGGHSGDELPQGSGSGGRPPAGCRQSTVGTMAVQAACKRAKRMRALHQKTHLDKTHHEIRMICQKDEGAAPGRPQLLAQRPGGKPQRWQAHEQCQGVWVCVCTARVCAPVSSSEHQNLLAITQPSLVYYYAFNTCALSDHTAISAHVFLCAGTDISVITAQPVIALPHLAALHLRCMIAASVI
eukprot:512004-Pelagomonas_calceolata.AAC.2